MPSYNTFSDSATVLHQKGGLSTVKSRIVALLVCQRVNEIGRPSPSYFKKLGQKDSKRDEKPRRHLARTIGEVGPPGLAVSVNATGAVRIDGEVGAGEDKPRGLGLTAGQRQGMDACARLDIPE